VKSISPLQIVELVSHLIVFIPNYTRDRIGSGTGIFTRALLGHPEWASSIEALKAVEPSEGMREVFCKSIEDVRVTVSEGTFDNTGVENGWADLVVVAQVRFPCKFKGSSQPNF
jgi:hypothetical protein